MRLKIAFLALAALSPVAACSDAGDPAADSTDTGIDTSGDTSGSDADGDVTRPDTGGGEDSGADGGGGEDTGTDGGPSDTGTDDTGSDDTGTGDGGTDTADDAGDGSGSYVCGSDPFFSGQIFGTEVPNGGAPFFIASASEIEYPDANLAAVAAVYPAEDPDAPIVLDTPIAITGATVVATNYTNDAAVPPSQSTFWVADSSGVHEVRLDFSSADNVAPFQIRVGHIIDFNVTAVSSYFGAGQIAAADGWNLQSTDNAVYVLERSATPITADDITRIIRVEGEITGGGSGCGGSSLCWDLSYAGDQTITFRSASTFVALGQCVTFVGPVSQFDGAPQLNVSNFGWSWTPR